MFRWSTTCVLVSVWFLSNGLLVRAAEPKTPSLLLPVWHTWTASVSASADGKLVVTGSSGDTAKVWDAETGKCLQTLAGHSDLVRSVWMSADGKRVVTGSLDKTAKAWDTDTGKCVQTLTGHTSFVCSVWVSADGKRVVTGSGDKTAKVWDADTGKCLQTLAGHSDLVRSVWVSADGKRVVTGSGDKTAKVWDADTGKRIQTLTGHADWVDSACCSGDGSCVVTGSGDGKAKVWDADTGKCIQTLTGHTYAIRSVWVSADGKRVVTGSNDKTAKVWDAASGKCIQTLTGHTDAVDSVWVSADGKRVVSGSYDKTAKVWDADTGKCLQTLTGHILGYWMHGNGKHGVTGSNDKTAKVWDIETGICSRTLMGSVGGGWAVLEKFEHKICERVVGQRVWMSGDGKRVVTGSGDNSAKVWDAETGKCIQTLTGHTNAVLSVWISADGKRVVTGSGDKTAKVWDADTGKCIQTLTGHADWVDSACCSGDGSRVVTGSGDKTAKVWDADTGKCIQTLTGHTDAVLSVWVSASGKRVVTGSNDKTAKVWDADTGKCLEALTGHTDWVRSVCASADGKRVVTASEDKTAKVWDADTGKCLQTLAGHTDLVLSVWVSAESKRIVTGSGDGTIRHWNCETGRMFCGCLQAGDESIMWTPEGYYTCSPGAEQLISWKIDDPTAPHGYRIVGPEQFRKKFYRPDLFKHLLAEGDLDKAIAKADKEAGLKPEPATSIAKAVPPVVVLVEPKRAGEVDQDKIAVEAVAVDVGDHPVTRLRVLVDGRPYQGQISNYDVPDPKPGNKVRKTWQVELEPGDHTIQVVADSEVSEGRSETVRIRRKATVETLPRLFVLAVGISEYQNADLRKGVYYCAADAKRLSDTLEKSSKTLYREAIVTRLTDKEATRANILKAMTKIRKEATQRDAVVIFFAGHGKRDDQANFFFLPVEVDLDDLAATGLSEGDFKASVKAMPGKVILMLDSCHSGALIENDKRSGDGPTDKLYRDLTSNEYGLVMMCSSKGVELSGEGKELNGGKGAGYFTQALVEGLEGKAPLTEGAVYLKALDGYVTERVKTLSGGKQHPLTKQPDTISNIPLTKPGK